MGIAPKDSIQFRMLHVLGRTLHILKPQKKQRNKEIVAKSYV